MATTALEKEQRIAMARPPAGAAPHLRARAMPWREFEDMGRVAAWDALASWASEPNPFFESWYLLPSLRALDPDSTVELLCVECDGALAGLLPVRRERGYYTYPLPHLRGWVHANCFVGAPLVAQGCEKPFWQALFAWCDADARGSLFLHLPHLPLDGPLHEALVEVLRREGRRGELVMREERALLASPLSADSYLEASLTPKKRKELRRQHNRLSEQGVLGCERRRDGEGLAAWTESFLELEAAGWKGAAGSALACEPATAALFAETVARAARLGRLERLSLTLDGRPIAMLATLLAAPAAFAYKTAFDEDYARFSPGVLLQRENLALLDDRDIGWCDSCASADHPMIDHFWRERRAIGRVSIAIGGPLRRLAFGAIATFETRRNPNGDLA